MQPATNVIQLSDYIPRKPADRPENVDRCYHCGTRLACLGTCRSCYEALRDAGRLSELKRPGARSGQIYRCISPVCGYEIKEPRGATYSLFCEHLNLNGTACGAEMRPVAG